MNSAKTLLYLPEAQGQYSNVFIQYGLHFKRDKCVKRGERKEWEVVFNRKKNLNVY